MTTDRRKRSRTAMLWTILAMSLRIVHYLLCTAQTLALIILAVILIPITILILVFTHTRAHEGQSYDR